jgi:LPS-assembly protein
MLLTRYFKSNIFKLYSQKRLFSVLFGSFLLGICFVASAETLVTNLAAVDSTVESTVESNADSSIEPATDENAETKIDAEAQTGAIEIEGDKLDLHLDRKMRASGNAVIRKGEQEIHGDSIEYNVQNDELDVKGNARIELGDSNITGPELKMKLNDGVGEMQDASVNLKKPINKTEESQRNDPSVYTQSKLLNTQTTITDNPKLYQDNYREPATPIGKATIDPRFDSSRGDAKQVLFEGQDKKRLKGARYTTCEPGVDDWYIKAKEIELNDYTQSGVAKNAYVEFMGVPVLYTPYMSFSFNNERKSGLLAPNIGSTSRSGFETTVPYYINIAPDKDATVAMRYLSKRGAQVQGEFRYLGENYSGVDALEFLNNDTTTGATRFYGNLSHSHNFGAGWSAGFNIERVSDDQYFSELSTRIISTSRVNLPQEGRIDYVSDVWRFNGIVQKFQTLDKVNYPYERLPQLTLTANKQWGAVDAELFSQYAYFDRNDKATLAATGSRFTVYPSISVPFTQSYGYVTPRFGIHSTHYSLSDNNFISNNQTVSNNTDSRTLPIFSVDSGLYFERDFNVRKSNKTQSSYTQTFEPRLFYVYIPDQKQDLLPVFDSALADLNLSTLFSENQFTGNDRINNANQVSLAVTSRLIDKDSGVERVAATIGERFYFDDQNVTLPGGTKSKGSRSDIIAALTARLSNKWNLDAFGQYNTDGNGVVRGNILARYNPEPGKLMNVGYRYTKEFLEQFNISGQWPISRGWYGVGRVNYSVKDKKLIESLAGLEYDAGCWQARAVLQRVETATAKANFGLFFQLELGGLASIGANPLNLLRRDIPGYLSSSEIPTIYRQQNYNQ